MTREHAVRQMNRGIDLREFQWFARRHGGLCEIHLRDVKRREEQVMARGRTWRAVLQTAQQFA